MKVLFLDIDGVLNWKETVAYLGLNDKMVKRLRRVLAETGAYVVLSSTWRKDSEAYSTFIRKTGIRPISKTSITSHGVRGREIQMWLDEHPEVSQYAIIDDDGDMLPEQSPFFVQTSFETGMRDEHAEALISILNHGENPGLHHPVFGHEILDAKAFRNV